MRDAGFTDTPRFSIEQAARIIEAAINRIKVEGYRLRTDGYPYVEGPDGSTVDVAS